MKTLKKVLAMTLAFATAMTMFVSASAAFTDQSDIKQSEAVDTLVALGVIKGNSDGSFAPDKTVTRGEMAKMIYVLRTGSDDGATAYSGLSTKFADISGNWAAPYIKYCSSMGIISGTSATKFDPNATVTGMQAAKMLLVCIGYDASKSGLTGASWSLNTAALGSGSHLFDEIDTDLNQAISRQDVARELCNAIDADTVVYDANGNVAKKTTTKDVTEKVPEYNNSSDPSKITGYTTVVKSQTNNETVGEKYLDLEKTVGVLGASGNAYLDGFSSEAGDNDLYVYDDGNSIDEGNDESSFSKITTDYSDLLGARVKVLYKKDHTDKVYGVYAMDENKINITTTADKLDTVSGEQKIKIGDTKYKIDDNCKIYLNNTNVTGKDFTFGSTDHHCGIYDYTASAPASDGTITYTAKSAIVTSALADFIDANNDNNGKVVAISNDDNDKINVIRLYTKAFAEVTSVTSKGIYVGKADCNANEYKAPTGVIGTYPTKFLFDDNKTTYYKDIAKDDYVLISYDYFNDKYVITKADKVTGDVTAYTTATKKVSGVDTSVAKKITINGTAYDVLNNTDYNDMPSLNKTCTLYVDGTYAYAVDVDASSSVDTAMIMKLDDSYSTMDKGVDAVLLFDDNTTKSVVINSVNGATIDSNVSYTGSKTIGSRTVTTIAPNGKSGDDDYTIYEGALVEYDTSSNKYQVTKVINSNYTDHGYSVVSGSYDDDNGTIGNDEIKDDAVIYVGYYKTDSDKTNKDMSYKAVSGKDFCNYSEGTVNAASTEKVFLQKKSSGVEYVQLGSCIMDSKVSNTGNTTYGYVTEAPSTVKNSDNEEVSQMTVWNGSKEVTLTCDDKVKQLAKGSFVSYDLVNDVANNVDVLTVNDDGTINSSGSLDASDFHVAAVQSFTKGSGSRKDRVSFYNIVSNKDGADISYSTVVSDSKIVYFDKDNTEGVSGGNIAQATSKDGKSGCYIYNAIIIPDDSNPDEIAGLFIETSNDLTGTGAYYDTNEKIALNADSNTISAGNAATLTATATSLDSNAFPNGTTVNWTSSNASVATVAKTSTISSNKATINVTGVAAGTATITATVTDADGHTFSNTYVITVTAAVTATPVITGTPKAGDTTISGTCVDSAAVMVSINSGVAASASVTGTNWTITVSPLVKGNTISVVATKAPAVASAAATATVVGVTATPVITGTPKATDTVISGTCVDGATVMVSINSGVAASASVTGTNWTITVSPLAQNDTISVVATAAPDVASAAATATATA